MARVLNEAFGIEEGDQHGARLHQRPALGRRAHSDWRRSRAAAERMSFHFHRRRQGRGRCCGAGGTSHGIAAWVPVPDGSVVDLFCKLGKQVSVSDVHAAVREAAARSVLQGILQYSERPTGLPSTSSAICTRRF